MRVTMTILAAVLLTIAPVAIAHAADQASGKALAQKLCVNCHIVAPDGAQGSVEPGIPSFMAIANKPDQDATKLRAFILNPHPPMPAVQLTTHELDNLVAYVLTLRDAE